MSKMSARFVAQKIGMSTAWVYDLWNKMGLVHKDKFGGWILTAAGKSVGGRMSKGKYASVPTFDFSVVERLMIDFYKNCVD